MPDVTPDGRAWPLVSIVTPSYNQDHFIEETIRSVLLQGYPKLEYIIIDDGSVDASVDVIRRYEDWLTYWVSQPNAGQSSALNRGFARSRGEIMTWLNSDDTYAPGGICRAVQALLAHPRAALVYGDCDMIDADGKFKRRITALPFNRADALRCAPPITQTASFFRRHAWNRLGPLRPDYHYCMDLELFVSMAEQYDLVYVPEVWGNFRLHSSSKTYSGQDPFTRETVLIMREHHRRLRLVRLALKHPGAYLTPSTLVFLAARMLPEAWMRRINRARGYA